jgi:hypothetical protein
MKKILSVMLGLSLLTGAAATAFGQTDTNKKKSSKKKKKKSTTTTDKK